MKKLVLAVLLLVGTAAYADTLTFTGSTASGVNGPYSMILGTAPVTQMICFSDNNFITGGESWTVQAYNSTQAGTALLGTTFGGSNVGATTSSEVTALYNELGYLGVELFADPGNPSIQQAIWSVLGLGGTSNSYNTAALSAVEGGYTTSDEFYIPVGDFPAGEYPYGTPQPFMSQVPEPSSLVLLGAGLLGLIGLSLKKVTA
jgi:hypothetical protein